MARHEAQNSQSTEEAREGEEPLNKMLRLPKNEADILKETMLNFCVRVLAKPDEVRAGEVEALSHVLELLLSYFPLGSE